MAKQIVFCLLLIAAVNSLQLMILNETELETEMDPVTGNSITTTISALNELMTTVQTLTTVQTEITETDESTTTSISTSPSESLLNLNVNVNELSESEIIELLSALEEPPSAPSPTFNFSAAAPTFEHSCAPDEYQCLFTGECVPYVFVCDHHFIDCGDGSDEYPHYRPPAINNTLSQTTSSAPLEQCSLCGGNSFQCPVTSECIPRGWLCDGQQDCGQTTKGPDTADEDGAQCAMNQVRLSLDNTDNLTAALLLEPSKPYVLFYDTSRIISLLKSFINESAADSVILFHRNTPGTDDDANDHNGNNKQNISQMLTITKDRRVCWLDAGKRAIQCISLLQLLVPPSVKTPKSDQSDNSSSELFYLPSYLNVDSISRVLVDWLTDNWYLLDGRSELLYLCSPPLSACTVIANHSVLSRPLAAELDATEGLLFISRHGDRSRLGPKSLGPAILKCSLDGSNVQTLVDVRIVEPRQLAVDVPQRKLYWVDVYLDILEQVDFDGLNRQQLKLSVEGSLPAWSHVHSIFAQSNKLYLLQSKRKPPLLSTSISPTEPPENRNRTAINLVAIDLESGLFNSHWHSQNSELEKPLRSSLLYNVADSSLRKVMKRLCRQCRTQEQKFLICVPQFDYLKMQIISASCVPSLEARTLDEEAKSDDESAVDSEEAVLVYSRSEPGKIAVLGRRKGESGPFTSHYLPITFSRCPTLFDTDPTSGTIVYVDDCSRRLYAQKLLQTASTPVRYLDLKSAGFEQVEGLSIDFIGGNVYLLDSALGSLYVLDLATLRHRRQLISGLANPKALVVDPVNQMLFFSQYGKNLYEEEPDPEHPELGMFIKRARLDGSRGQILVKEPYLKFVNGLSVDAEERFLYWCDAFYHRIERVHYDGTGRQLLTAGLRIGIANSLHLDAYQKVLYWTELQHGTVQAYNLKSNTTEVVLQEKAPLLSVKLYRPKQKLSKKGNDSFPLNCHHLKLLGGKNGARCVCADGFMLHPFSGSQCIDVGVSVLSNAASAAAQESSVEAAACEPNKSSVLSAATSGTNDKLRCQVGGTTATSTTFASFFASTSISITIAVLITLRL